MNPMFSLPPRMKEPVRPGAPSVDITWKTCTVLGVDIPQKLAMIMDQFGKLESISLSRFHGKPLAYPAQGENWILANEFGSWFFAVSVNNGLVPLNVVNTLTASATLDAIPNTHYVYFVSGTSITISLPTAVGNTCIYKVKNTGSATITIDPFGTETFNGSSTYSVLAAVVATFCSNGTNWQTI